ncbi:MAG: hypothetical protein P8I51_04385 [Polaribacter sp.]|nr:hypothetical protein [Polaribacter sp.]
MGIFDRLFGKQPKKETLTDYQKHWLGLVDIRVNAISFDFIKKEYTADSHGEEHYEEYKINEHRVPKEKRQEVAQSRVDGLLSIRDYIKDYGSEEQKFHYESSLKGAVLYASSLGINFDLPELKKMSSLEKFKDYYPFEDVIKNMRKLLGDEVFDIIGEQAGFKLNENEDKIETNIKPSKDQLLINFYNNYKTSYSLCLTIADQEKINLSKVLDDMIFNVHNLINKKPNWFKNISGTSEIAVFGLMNTCSFGRNTFAYDNGFELGEYDEGILASSESIFNKFLESAKRSKHSLKEEVSTVLDTFGYGLYLKKEFEYSLIIFNKSIELSPNHEVIAEHLTNRGKSKLKLNDKEGARLDFEKALEKDANFEEAKTLLESIGK